MKNKDNPLRFGHFYRVAGIEGEMHNMKEVMKIVLDWYDTSVKLPNSNLAMLVTNGGYIPKLTLHKILQEKLNKIIDRLQVEILRNQPQ